MGLNHPTSITLFIPCLMDVFYPNMAQALVTLLKNLGFSPKYPQAQTCCGQPAFNQGFIKQAKALADTGTLALFSKNSSGRWISLAPKIHIVLLPVACILSSLDELCSKLDLAGDLSSFGSAITFISGPSRTADIELNIVMGAHGPKELHVVTLLFPINSLGSKGNIQC